jgi:hypothetical protein
MLKEWFEYNCTPAAGYARKMGYVHQVIATKARYGRQQKAWRKHIENTKEMIIKAADAAPHKRKVVVLGAGNCLDVPLARLSQMFDEVVLVDVVFLRCTKKLAKRFGAALVEADVTGMAELMLAANVQAAKTATPDLFLDDESVDLIVSCNIASQLPFNLLPFLPEQNEAQQFLFCADVISKHIAYVKRFTCTKIIVTDVEFFMMENDHVKNQPALCGIKLPELHRTWRWDITPLGEADKGVREWHEVGAVIVPATR